MLIAAYEDKNRVMVEVRKIGDYYYVFRGHQIVQRSLTCDGVVRYLCSLLGGARAYLDAGVQRM